MYGIYIANNNGNYDYEKTGEINKWWSWRDSNPLPFDCQSNALPIELQPHALINVTKFIYQDKD